MSRSDTWPRRNGRIRLLRDLGPLLPWPTSQGHAPYAWSVRGAAAWATSGIPLMTCGTCPTLRHHPVVIAQKAATVQLLSEGRFRLGLGSGENLNEHVVGRGRHSIRVQLAMPDEAAEIIRALSMGEYVTRHGRHFQVDDARLRDLPGTPPTRTRSPPAPTSSSAGCWVLGAGCWVLGAGCWVAGASMPNFRPPGGVRPGLRGHPPEDVAKSIPCGDDVDAVLDAARPFAEAGFTDLALVRTGGAHQTPFLHWAETALLPALRDL